MTGRIEVAAAVADRGVELSLDLRPGMTTAVVGENGAGKSTLLGLLSGLVRPSSGTVVVAGRRVAGPATFVPAHRRDVALLTQRALLFPHLDVTANVAFGVAARGASRTAALARARTELAAIGATDLAGRRPDQLSGGQAQRVALARALATDPAILLLDEPLAALDVHAAAAMRTLLAERLHGRTAVLVTHDPLDLWTLAHDVAVLASGRVVASGPAEDLLGRPSSSFLARLSGVNLLRGVACDGGVRVGTHQVSGLWDPTRVAAEEGRALATFTPASVALFRDESYGSPRNLWTVSVTGLEPRGATVRVLLDLDGQALAADLTAPGVAALALALGETVRAQVKATQVTLYAR